MFFIGGFNSVIPYVIYLSLIWMFVILSFGGRIAAMLHKQPDNQYASAKIIFKSGDDHYIHCYHYNTVKPLQSVTAAGTPDLPQLSASFRLSQHTGIRYDSPPLPSPELFSFLFRGPPLLSA
jgi:hypothetical protein